MLIRYLTASAARAALAVLACLAVAPAARASTEFYVNGAGNGHGIGMSQYGAAGYALHGESYEQILRDYYAQTTLGHVDPTRTVTVLLRPAGAAAFSGANRIVGSGQKLNPVADYRVIPAAGRLRLVSGNRKVGTFAVPLRVSGLGPLALNGLGSYRGDLVFRPNPQGNGVMTVNAIGLDDYVRGVVAAEMPANWPQQALDAQAVAARTYAITVAAKTPDFMLYNSTRSQMYRGVSAETPQTDAAVAATSGQVVEYNGIPVTTYFFSSSGGRTESVQNVWQVAPAPWLVSRSDPYDDSFNNPYHHWKLSFDLGLARSRLGRFVHGSLEGIKVLDRGISPRVVKARIVGTGGSVTVTGEQLQKALGAPSTWMSFTTVSAHGVETSTVTSTTPTATSTTPAAPSGSTPTPTTTTAQGNGAGGLARSGPGLMQPFSLLDHIAHLLRLITGLALPAYAVTGDVFPARPGAVVTVQADNDGAWVAVGSGKLGRGGRYSVPVTEPGTYRVLYRGIAGPQITLG
jgi:stage II sporulation protein D